MSDRRRPVSSVTSSEVGSVCGAPDLPGTFAHTFRSWYLSAGEIRLHVVVGGGGPPLYLLGGWPQTWYAWRLVMPELAERHTVVAIDPRGCGLSDKPATGYDSATMAGDVLAVADGLGHDTVTLVGHDIGMWTAYALAVDHPGRLDRLALIDAIIPGVGASPPLISDGATSNFLWHFAFNRAHGVNEAMVRGREEIYFGHQFATKAAHPDSLAASAVAHYVDMLRDPGALRASFEYYRAIDDIIEQNQRRRRTRLQLPVLAVGGALSCGGAVAAAVHDVADDVTGVVVPGCGHFVPEEAPAALLHALGDFLDPPGWTTPRRPARGLPCASPTVAPEAAGAEQ